MEDNQVFANRVYSIEVKKDYEEFEEFNPDLIKLQIFLWKNEFAGLEEKLFTHDTVKIDRKKPLKELQEKIYKLYNFTNESLYIFKKMEFNQNSYTITEIMNDEKNLGENLINNAIYDGNKIFIEVKHEGWESNFVRVRNLVLM